MMGIGTRDLRPTTAFLRQVALSVAATLIASAVLSGLRSEWAFVRSGDTSAAPLTSGGKFAARVEAMTLTSEAAIDLPGMAMPKPVLASLPSASKLPVQPAGAMAADFRPAPDTLAKPKRPPRVETAHRRPMESAAVVPPRRIDYVGDERASLPAVEVYALSGVWSTTRSLVGQAASWSGAVLDKLTPSGLLP